MWANFISVGTVDLAPVLNMQTLLVKIAVERLLSLSWGSCAPPPLCPHSFQFFLPCSVSHVICFTRGLGKPGYEATLYYVVCILLGALVA